MNDENTVRIDANVDRAMLIKPSPEAPVQAGSFWSNRERNCAYVVLLPRACSPQCERGGGQWFCGKSRHSAQLVRYLGYLRYRRINKLCIFNVPNCRCPIHAQHGWES
jgi:hypothetical protein